LAKILAIVAMAFRIAASGPETCTLVMSVAEALRLRE
jgi:hypothetical protein